VSAGSGGTGGLKARWERRAAEQGTTLSGVLYRGLPESLNAHLHRWHAELVTRQLLPRVPQGGRVLDLGCGFGRLGTVVRATRDDVALCGVDLATNYCRMFTAATGASALCADLSALPFAPRSVDAIIAVTCLMYVAPERAVDVVRSLHGLLKPGGAALLVDPGREFTALVAALRPSSRDTPTGGRWFTRREYDALAGQAGVRVLGRGGVPLFSAGMPVLYGLSRWPAVVRPALAATAALDRRLGALRGFTIHRWMLTAPGAPGTDDVPV
jgi:SAM-dependent methyltransferase